MDSIHAENPIRCLKCGGCMTQVQTEITLNWQGRREVTIPDAWAYRCQDCGEETFTAAEAERLLTFAEVNATGEEPACSTSSKSAVTAGG